MIEKGHMKNEIKWFSIKGNKTCDVYKKEVQNLPVALLRMQSVHAGNTQATGRAHPIEAQHWRGQLMLQSNWKDDSRFAGEVNILKADKSTGNQMEDV